MSHRIEQVNELLARELGQIISKELPLEEGFITISYVKCSPDLLYAKVGFSVIPDQKAATAQKNLKKHNSLFTKVLQKRTRLGHIPKFDWVIDESGKEADEMDKLFRQIEKE